MSFFQNACKPNGLGGKIMVNMMNKGHASLSEWGFEHIAVPEDGLSLDLGCGGGANVKKLLEKSPQGKVTGLDYSDISVEKSRKMNQTALKLGQCEILKGSVMELPFPKESFHLATAFETIYFWPDIFKAFEQVYKVLKDQGVFMICNEANGKNSKDEKWTNLIKGMTIYTSKQLQTALQQAGFSEMETDENSKGWICVAAKKNLRQPLA